MRNYFKSRKKLSNWAAGLIIMLLSLTIVTQIHPAVNAATAAATLVDIRSINPRIALDIRYATKNNFMKQQLYRQGRCLLRKSVADKLSQVQTYLETQKLGLKVYDCYRPLSVQKRMWQIKPDPNYVANPVNGSRHNRASAVDVTLVDRTGKEVQMPTQFDDFSDRAHRNYNNLSNAVKQNRQTLEKAMVRYGFVPLQTEWWHFDAKEWRQFGLLDTSFDAIPQRAVN